MSALRPSSTTDQDVRDLLGMRQPGAWLVAAAFLAATWSTIGYILIKDPAEWPTIPAGVILTAAVVAILQVPGDPLPLGTTIALAAAGPAACACALWATAGPGVPWTSSLMVMWAHSGITAVYCFMCVRGRLVAPWLGFLAASAVYAFWAESLGQSPVEALRMVAINLAPLIMGTLFSLTLRPTARAVFALRSQTITQVARLSADAAADEERANQVAFLDSLARPMLERIASGAPLTGEERIQCALLEAHLRDRLRAPLMTALDLEEPAYRARAHGVEVVFIDDSGARPDGRDTDPIDSRVASAVSDLAGSVLAAARTGQVFVRVAPPHGSIAASVLHRRPDGSSVRSEIDKTGGIRSYN
ncbi:MAG: hypothetical protein SW127_17025 [Actinomycetota bacterium]|nr:hypothetical protein [Actinomycetota bacterium]